MGMTTVARRRICATIGCRFNCSCVCEWTDVRSFGRRRMAGRHGAAKRSAAKAAAVAAGVRLCRSGCQRSRHRCHCQSTGESAVLPPPLVVATAPGPSASPSPFPFCCQAVRCSAGGGHCGAPPYRVRKSTAARVECVGRHSTPALQPASHGGMGGGLFEPFLGHPISPSRGLGRDSAQRNNHDSERSCDGGIL